MPNGLDELRYEMERKHDELLRDFRRAREEFKTEIDSLRDDLTEAETNIEHLVGEITDLHDQCTKLRGE